MNHRSAALQIIVFFLVAFISETAFAQGAGKGDRAFGEYLSSACVTCHQISGKSVGAIPPIVGWPQDQFIAVMLAYKNKDRDNTTMQTIAEKLKQDELEALAEYFGSIKPK
jgi:cytochrome c553